jgi:hypothetical protein
LYNAVFPAACAAKEKASYVKGAAKETPTEKYYEERYIHLERQSRRASFKAF